jgi:hypothetical protein
MLAHTETGGRQTLPIVHHYSEVPGSLTRFSTACFAGEGMEWSMKLLQKPEDVFRHPAFAHDLRAALREMGAVRAFAPTPTEFNGVIIGQDALTDRFDLGEGMTVHRNILMPADGTFLKSAGDAGIFSASGCGVIMAALGQYLVFAHAGRDCLIDRKRILRTGGRAHESVVDYIVHALLALGCAPEDMHSLHAWMFYSIKPEEFLHRYDDEKHREYNKLVGSDLERRGLGAGVRHLAEGVELDLPIVANLQFMQYGSPAEHIHLEHRYLHDELPTTRTNGGRYLVTVVRHS